MNVPIYQSDMESIRTADLEKAVQQTGDDVIVALKTNDRQRFNHLERMLERLKFMLAWKRMKERERDEKAN